MFNRLVIWYKIKRLERALDRRIAELKRDILKAPQASACRNAQARFYQENTGRLQP
jgi:hypothetical protein